MAAKGRTSRAMLLLSAVLYVVAAEAKTVQVGWSMLGSSDIKVTINVGDTVKWVWEDVEPHSVWGTENAAGMFTGPGGDDQFLQGPGSSYSYTFTKAGTYPFTCVFHDSMYGIITVLPGKSSPPPPRRASPPPPRKSPPPPLKRSPPPPLKRSPPPPLKRSPPPPLKRSPPPPLKKSPRPSLKKSPPPPRKKSPPPPKKSPPPPPPKVVAVSWALGRPAIEVTVKVGDSVEWIWEDGKPHSVKGVGSAVGLFTGPGGGDNTIRGLGSSYAYRFTKAGSYPFKCALHSTMNGVIRVV